MKCRRMQWTDACIAVYVFCISICLLQIGQFSSGNFVIYNFQLKNSINIVINITLIRSFNEIVFYFIILLFCYFCYFGFDVMRSHGEMHGKYILHGKAAIGKTSRNELTNNSDRDAVRCPLKGFFPNFGRHIFQFNCTAWGQHLLATFVLYQIIIVIFIPYYHYYCYCCYCCYCCCGCITSTLSYLSLFTGATQLLVHIVPNHPSIHLYSSLFIH